jgi:hypothetical protein
MKGSVKNLPEYILGADRGKHGGIVLLNTKYNPVEIKPGDIVIYPLPAEVPIPFYKFGWVTVNENRILCTVNENLSDRKNNLKNNNYGR